MLINGIDTAALAPQFEGAVHGRTLIIDGDGPAYVAAATVKRLDTGISRFKQHILQAMFLAGAQDCRVHLTARDSDKFGRFRVKAVKPYQGQRKSKDKPPLLEPLREAMALRENWLEEFVVFLHHDKEADDYMMQDAYVFKEDGVIRSEDKDLRMTPYPYYCMDRGEVRASQPHGYLTIKHTASGTPKCLGQGPMFFWAQMLMGDTADHVQGILRLNKQLCGPVAAYGALKDFTVVHDAANFVLDAYRAINQNAVAEGWLLWLTRWDGDNVIEYMRSLALTPQNRDFIEDCVLRDWVKPKEDRHVEDF